MNKLHYLLILSFLFVFINCSNKKSPEDTELLNNEKELVIDSNEEKLIPENKVLEAKPKPKPQKKKIAINSIVAYQNPVSIEELYSKSYVVDTLIWNTVTNGLGRDDDVHEIIFNKIIGIDTNGVKNRKPLFAMQPRDYFDPTSKIKDDYYLPFCVDGECDFTIVLKWKQTENGLKLVKHFRNRFYTKYGRLKVSNILEDGENRFLLIEVFLPDESARLARNNFVVKETDENSLIILDEFSIRDKTLSEDFLECCSMELKNNRLAINSKIDGLNFEKIIEINVEKNKNDF